MSDRTLYYPIFKGKRAEFFALRDLTPDVASIITPVVELYPLDSDEETKRPAALLAVHLRQSAAYMARSWGARRFLVDARALRRERALTEYCEHARKLSLNAIPVLSTRLSAKATELGAAIIVEDTRGACLRERVADAVSPSWAKKLLTAVGRLKLEPAAVDLIIDLGEVTDDNADDARVLAETAIRAVPQEKWRSLVLTSCAFPNLAGSKSGTYAFARHDWDIWAELDDVPRRPRFSDHTIVHPKPGKKGAAKYVSAQVRYTTPTQFAVYRGKLLMKHGHEQYAELASKLVGDRQVYCGPNFSVGDAYLKELAAAKHKGGPAPLLQAGINHHLTMTARQLASPSALSGPRVRIA